MSTLADVHAAFGDWLALPHKGHGACFEAIDVGIGTVVANRLAGDPLWVFLVAPPSSGKTEIIQSLRDVPDVYALSSLTAQTFASGFERKGMETSLLLKIGGKTVTMKDFGTVLTLHRETKLQILAQLREIYDGAFSKDWGNGKRLEWSGKVGLLAGVTPIIDREWGLNQSLGERFLLFRLHAPPSREIARRALDQRAREMDQRRHLRDIVTDFLTGIPLAAPPYPSTYREGLAALAEFTALARSPIIFDARGEIELIPDPEAPARLAKQLAILGQAVGVVRSEIEITPETYATVARVAQDTIPKQRRVMIESLLAFGKDAPSTTDVAERTKYPTSTVRRYLQELAALDLATRLPGGGQGKTDHWRASSRLIGLLRDAVDPMKESTGFFKSVGRSEESE
jgi:hypothetical protein